ERRAHRDGHGGIRDIDPGAATKEIQVGIPLEEVIQLRAGEFDCRFLVTRDRLVQAAGGFVCGFGLDDCRFFDLDIDGSRGGEIAKSFLVKPPAADADDCAEKKSKDENGETALGETAHARARRRIINRRRLDRWNWRRRRRRWWRWRL